VTKTSRTAVVTGSASGMGSALCDRLSRHGARVIGVDRRDADILADLGTGGGRRSAIEAVLDVTGGRLDCLVTCAGLGPHEEPTEIAKVNYFGTVVLLDGIVGALGRGDSPAAVVFASNAASLTPRNAGLLRALEEGDEDGAVLLAASLDGTTVYGMTKLALVKAMRRRVREWGETGVRLNAVAPGPIDTPMLDGILADSFVGPMVEALPVPLGRIGTPDEVASAVEFLLDPTNAFVHGSVLFVDGGSDAELRPEAI